MIIIIIIIIISIITTTIIVYTPTQLFYCLPPYSDLLLSIPSSCCANLIYGPLSSPCVSLSLSPYCLSLSLTYSDFVTSHFHTYPCMLTNTIGTIPWYLFLNTTLDIRDVSLERRKQS